MLPQSETRETALVKDAANKERFLDSDYYFSQLSQNTRESLTFEQSQEIKDILKRAIRVPSKKLVNVETTFWFIKRFYIVLYLGLDRRKWFRAGENKSLPFILKLLLHLGLSAALWAATLFVFITAVYYAKSTLGIDLIPDQHINDVFTNGS